MARKMCTETMQLLDWETPEVAPTMPTDKVRAASLRDRVARAVALCLGECDLSREVIAERMTEFLGTTEKPVTKAIVDAYASQAKEDHTISAIRLVALAHATGDVRPFQVLLEPLDQAVIERRYVSAIEETLIDQQIERLTQQKKLKRMSWRGRS